MKVLIWCSDTKIELRLTNLIKNNFDLVGIVIERKMGARKRTVGSIIKGIINRTVFFPLNLAWSRALNKFEKEFPKWPDVDSIIVEKINSEEAYNFSIKKNCDVVVVSSTTLIKSKMINIQPRFGILNLHTGLSPYINGGPNCTNWCLSNGDYHKIGNTIMYLNEGIDSGDIIKTRALRLQGEWSHCELLFQTVKQGQDLYIETLKLIQEKQRIINSSPQHTIGKGVTYYNKDWGLLPRIKLIINFYLGNYSKAVNSKAYVDMQKKLTFINGH